MESDYNPALLRPRKGSNASVPEDKGRRRKRVQWDKCRSYADANSAEVAELKMKLGVAVLECPPFALEEEDGWMSYLRRNGFVVIKNVLSQQAALHNLESVFCLQI